MPKIHVLKEKCVKCGLCQRVCPFDAIKITEDFPRFNNNCRFCGACVSACPVQAIVLQLEKVIDKVDLSQYKGVIVFAEQREGQITPVVYELIGKGRELAEKLGEPLYIALLGYQVKDEAKKLGRYDVNKIIFYDHPLLERYRDDPYVQLIVELLDKVKPNIVLIGATSIGRTLGPKLASKLDTGLTADCTELDIDEEKNLIQIRPAFGGNVMAKIITPSHRPQIATVLYKVMMKATATNDLQSELI